MTVPFIRKSTQRNSSWPKETALHLKAAYICADLSIDPSLFPCSRAADHTFLGVQLAESSYLNLANTNNRQSATSRTTKATLGQSCGGNPRLRRRFVRNWIPTDRAIIGMKNKNGWLICISCVIVLHRVATPAPQRVDS